MMLAEAWLNDLKIHDVDALDSIPYALRAAGLGSGPAPKARTEEKPRAHGSINRTRFYGARIFTLEGYCDASADGLTDVQAAAATEEAVDLLKRELALNGAPVVFKFRRLGWSFYERLEVVPAGAFEAPSSGWEPFVRWAVALEAPDPRIYSDTLSSGSYDPAAGAASGGLVFPLTFPLTFAGTGATYLTVNNAGSVETPPVFTITGPLTPATAIDNETTGESIYFNELDVSSGDEVVVDVAQRSLTYEGVARPDKIDGRLTTWFQLQPGDNRLRLRGGAAALGTTELAVTFRDARQ